MRGLAECHDASFAYNFRERLQILNAMPGDRG